MDFFFVKTYYHSITVYRKKVYTDWWRFSLAKKDFTFSNNYFKNEKKVSNLFAKKK